MLNHKRELIIKRLNILTELEMFHCKLIVQCNFALEAKALKNSLQSLSIKLVELF